MTQCRPSPRIPVLLLWMLVLSFVANGIPAAAQSLPSASTPPTPAELVSDMLMRHATQAMAGGGDPTTGGPRSDQLIRAQVLIDLALELTPDDADLWDFEAELSRMSGDEVARQQALRRYAQLRPQEDAVQLELVLSELADIETLDGRLKLLEERMTSLTPPQMTPALRSRLASSAAALALEMGDESLYLQHLKTAVTSDSANPEAADMTYALALEKNAPPRSRALAAMNVVRARPIDSDARVLLAGALADVGAYDRAAEQFDMATQLPRATPVDAASLPVWSRCLIATGRTGDAAELLDQIESYYANPGGGDAEATAEEGGRPVPTELLLHRRVLTGDTDAGDAAIQRVLESLRPGVEAGDADALLDSAWVVAVFGKDTQRATELLQGLDQNDTRYRRASGFVFMREGSESWARNAFEAIAPEDDIAAYGLALLQGRDEAGKARFLGEVIRQDPGSFGALLAARQLQAMGREVRPGEDGEAVIAAMNRLPGTLWRLEMDRTPWITARARFEEARSDFLRPITAEVVVSNQLDIPLPIDPELGIDRQVLASVAAYSGGKPLGQLPPMMLTLPRKLTLDPRQQLSAPARLDRSLFGMYLIRGAPGTLSYNVSFVFGPRFLPEGGVVTGPLGSLDTIRSLQAFIPAYTQENLSQWTERAVDGRGFQQMSALALISRAGENLLESEVDRTVSRAALASVNQAFENADTTTRGWILLMLPAQTRARSEFQPSLELAQRSDEALVRIAYLLTQATDPEAPALGAAIRDGSPRVQRFAEALRQALQVAPPATAADTPLQP